MHERDEFYCSICFPRNAEAVIATFCSVSPIDTEVSLPSIHTEPMTSPSLMMGLIVSDGNASPSVILQYFLLPSLAENVSRFSIAFSSSW